MELQGKVIVITGAAQGLGQKMAEIIAGQGAKLALVDLDRAKLQTTVRLCTKAGGKVKDYPADVTDEPAVEALFNSVRNDFGSVDGLINNAGITSDALLVKVVDGKVKKKMSVIEFHRVIAVDRRGVFLCGREATVQMIESGHGGVIINISSISRAGNVGQTNYAEAKAGVAADSDLGQRTRALQHSRRRHRSGLQRDAHGGGHSAEGQRQDRLDHSVAAVRAARGNCARRAPYLAERLLRRSDSGDRRRAAAMTAVARGVCSAERKQQRGRQ